MKIAFYKGRGNLFDKLIRIWTFSKYSHVELVVDDIWYTSSPRDNGVVARGIKFNPGNWDLFEINLKQNTAAIDFINEQMGKRYDWLGILLSQIIKLNIHAPNRWFCSEIVHRALLRGGLGENVGQSNNICPGKLHNALITFGIIKNNG